MTKSGFEMTDPEQIRRHEVRRAFVQECEIIDDLLRHLYKYENLWPGEVYGLEEALEIAETLKKKILGYKTCRS